MPTSADDRTAYPARAAYAGAPTNYLVYATVGPVAMLIVAALMLRGILPAEGSR